MQSRPWDNPPACSNCGSTRVAWIVQGLPNFGDPELRRLLDEGRILLGGCCFGDCWVCHDCAERERAGRGDQDSRLHVYGPSGWKVYAGGFDPEESDAAREARERAEEAAVRAEYEKQAAYRATPIGAFERLKEIVAGAEKDVRKSERGVKAAANRTLAAMREAEEWAQRVEEAVSNIRGMPR